MTVESHERRKWGSVLDLYLGTFSLTALFVAFQLSTNQTFIYLLGIVGSGIILYGISNYLGHPFRAMITALVVGAVIPAIGLFTPNYLIMVIALLALSILLIYGVLIASQIRYKTNEAAVASATLGMVLAIEIMYNVAGVL